MEKGIVKYEPTEIIQAEHQETVEESLQISPERHMDMTWFIDEICMEGGKKSDAIEKIAKSKFNSKEKVFMGFLLCKKYASMAPSPIREILMEYIS